MGVKVMGESECEGVKVIGENECEGVKVSVKVSVMVSECKDAYIYT